MEQSTSKWADIGLAALVVLITAVLHTVSFPFAVVHGKLLNASEAGYLFLVPLCLWLSRPRSLKSVLGTTWIAFFASWLVLLIWLRHVTWAGTVFVAAVMALFPMLWAVAAARALPGLRRRPALERIAVLAGLAGLWVVLEWVRSWLLTGFPWLPLAACQWDRPAMLQILPWTGYLGLSWVLLYFNLALCAYVLSLLHPRRGSKWWQRFSPELYSGLFLLAACVMFVAGSFQERGKSEILFQAGVVQPYEPGLLKWDGKQAQHNADTLKKMSTFASVQGAQLLFWPESATPLPMLPPSTGMAAWTEDVANSVKLPILTGSVSVDRDEKGNELYHNSVFLVEPGKGVYGEHYSKRKLVPFGESNPISWITDPFFKFDYTFIDPGEQAVTLPLNLPSGKQVKVGPLVCYEDVFPKMARTQVLEGADFLFVATNNAWYGEEAGAYQHAVHSVLRAVENRRPVLRCGNGGWSGAIDEYGNIRYLCARPDQGVYFEGEDVFPFERDSACAKHYTFYTLYGDWFTVPAFLLAVLAAFILRKAPPAPAPEGDPDNDDGLDSTGLTPERRRARALLRQGKFHIRRRLR